MSWSCYAAGLLIYPLESYPLIMTTLIATNNASRDNLISHVNIIVVFLFIIQDDQPLIALPALPLMAALPPFAAPLALPAAPLHPQMRVDHPLEPQFLPVVALLDLEAQLAQHLPLQLGLLCLLGSRVLLHFGPALAQPHPVALLFGEPGVSAHSGPHQPRPLPRRLEFLYLGQAGADALQVELVLGPEAAPVLEDADLLVVRTQGRQVVDQGLQTCLQLREAADQLQALQEQAVRGGGGVGVVQGGDAAGQTRQQAEQVQQAVRLGVTRVAVHCDDVVPVRLPRHVQLDAPGQLHLHLSIDYEGQCTHTQVHVHQAPTLEFSYYFWLLRHVSIRYRRRVCMRRAREPVSTQMGSQLVFPECTKLLCRKLVIVVIAVWVQLCSFFYSQCGLWRIALQWGQQKNIILLIKLRMDPNPMAQPQSQPVAQSQPLSEPSEQPSQMTLQLAQQLVQLLAQPKTQVKYATLNAILQHTKSQQSKEFFLQTQLFPLLVQYMATPQLHKICLSTLIHFSSCEAAAENMVPLVQPILMDLRANEGLIEELGLLLLLNVSKQYEFTNRLANGSTSTQKQQKQQQKQKQQPQHGPSLLLQILYSFMESKPSRRWVIANIFVNISSHDIGREYLARERLYLGFLRYINDQKQALRLAVLRVIRNVAFLWQNEAIISQLLKKQHYVIDHLAMHILIMVIKSKLVADLQVPVRLLRESGYNAILDYDMEIEPELQKIGTTKQKSLNEIEICIDTLVILSNADFPKRRPEFLKEELKGVIGVVNFTEITEEWKDKLEALQTFCFW